MSTKELSVKQKELAVKLAAQLTAIGLSVDEVTRDTWRFQAVNRVMEPKKETLGAIKALKGRAIFARSKREAEWQLEVLTAITAFEKDGISHPALDALKKQFVQREVATA